jgi:hypothetical protein
LKTKDNGTEGEFTMSPTAPDPSAAELQEIRAEVAQLRTLARSLPALATRMHTVAITNRRMQEVLDKGLAYALTQVGHKQGQKPTAGQVQDAVHVLLGQLVQIVSQLMEAVGQGQVGGAAPPAEEDENPPLSAQARQTHPGLPPAKGSPSYWHKAMLPARGW